MRIQELETGENKQRKLVDGILPVSLEIYSNLANCWARFQFHYCLCTSTENSPKILARFNWSCCKHVRRIKNGDQFMVALPLGFESTGQGIFSLRIFSQSFSWQLCTPSTTKPQRSGCNWVSIPEHGPTGFLQGFVDLLGRLNPSGLFGEETIKRRGIGSKCWDLWWS